MTPLLASGLFALVVNRNVKSNSVEENVSSKNLEDALYKLALKEIRQVVYTDQINADSLPENLVYKTFANHIHNMHPDLHQKICVEFQYCEKRKKWGSEMELSGAVLALTLALAELVATAGIGTILWLMSKGFFDELCDC